MKERHLPVDMSNGYEACAQQFMNERSETGLNIIRKWASEFTQGATILDLGCGNGIPITQTLIEAGLSISALDASPKMIAAFRQNYPHVEAACEAVETSVFFHRQFDGIVAIGLVFLLPIDSQEKLLRRIATTLPPEGRLLFTSPYQICNWTDALTGQTSRSLGAEAYRKILRTSGLDIVSEPVDEGENHYFNAVKR